MPMLNFVFCFLVFGQPGAGADLNQLSELSGRMIDSEAAIDIAPGTLTLQLRNGRAVHHYSTFFDVGEKSIKQLTNMIIFITCITYDHI